MDTKYVATFLLVAVMITRIQYGSGEDCEKVKQCMTTSGITFQSVVLNPTGTETLRKYFDIVCSKIDALLSCFNTTNVKICSTLQGHFPYLSMANNVIVLFTTVCAQKEGIIGVVECFAKNGTFQSIQQCARSAVDTQSNNQGNRTLSCSYVSRYTLVVYKHSSSHICEGATGNDVTGSDITCSCITGGNYPW